MSDSQQKTWHKVLDSEGLPENRVTTVVAGTHTIALTRYDGQYGALDNRCPHQGGPLGEGSIENGLLRCPWHGWDYCPISGKAPGFDDGVETFPVEVRDDGVYVQVPEPLTHTRTIADLLAETMVNWGVRHVFGMVGHSNLGMADALRRQEEAGNLQFIGIRHEGAASFACSAYAKLTGKPAACLAIAGPGATNLLTGLYDAKVDRAPVLALAGQVDTQVIGPGAFQEVNLQSAFQDVSAFNHTVFPDSRHGELMTLALKNAILTRNPVSLILPNEVQELPAPEGAEASGPLGRVATETIAPPEESFNKAVAALRGSKHPVIIVGHGARFHMEAITALAEKLAAPVLTTFKGKGLISDRHPLGCGVLGRSGTPIASWFMNEADLLLVIGASFSNHTGITSKIPTVQIDYDAMALGKFHRVEFPVWGEIGVTIRAINGNFQKTIDRPGVLEEVAQRWAIWREEKEKRLADDRGRGVNSASVFAAMNKVAPEDAVIAVDVGNNTYSFGRYFESSGKQSVLMSGYLGSIGFGFPAAMGAWAAVGGKRPVWCVTGDGGFGQYMAEVLTAVKYGMNITHVLLHNDNLGKISKEQRAGGFEVWKTDLHNPDFSEYYRICGGLGIRVTKSDRLEDAMQKAAAFDGPAVVEVMTDPDLV